MYYMYKIYCNWYNNTRIIMATGHDERERTKARLGSAAYSALCVVLLI
jgi:hypothetical protein